MDRHRVQGEEDDEQECKCVISAEAPEADCPQTDGEPQKQDCHADAVEGPPFFEELTTC